jgi:hypothetical protein
LAVPYWEQTLAEQPSTGPGSSRAFLLGDRFALSKRQSGGQLNKTCF